MKFIVLNLLLLSATVSAQPANPARTGPSVAQLEAAFKKNPENIALRKKIASLYVQEGKFDQVIALLNPYTDQLDSGGFLNLASSYSNRRDFANEVRVLNILTTKEEENFRWHMLLGQAYLKQASTGTDPERARDLTTKGVQQLRRTLQLQRTYKPAYDLLLTTLLQQKENNDARELLAEGITMFGKLPQLLRELCRLDAQDGFLVQAVEHCEESIKLSPDYPDHFVYYVQALYDQKEDLVAEREIVKASKKFTTSEFVQWAAGTFFFRKKNFPVATRYFQTAVNAKPDSARARFGLAQSMFESGNEAGALEHFVKVCKQDASTVDTFLAAAGKLKQRGDKLGQTYTAAANSCR